MFSQNDSVKVAKIQHVFAELHQIVFTKVSLRLQINGKKTPPFSFQLHFPLIKCTMHDATLRLVITQIL